MENPIYIKTMEQTAANFSELNTELSNIAKKMKSIELYNPQTQLFSLVRIAEPNTVQLRNLAARTVVGDSTLFNSEVSNILGISVEETHDWIKIIVPAILPKRNQRDSQAFLAVPLRNALRDFLNKNPMERFYKCAICIVHQYDVALGTMRILGGLLPRISRGQKNESPKHHTQSYDSTSLRTADCFSLRGTCDRS